MMENGIDKEQYKKIVEDIFEQIDKNKILNNDMSSIKKIFPDKNSVVDFCREKALEELELVRSAFVEFQNKISDLVLVDFLDFQIDEFAKYAVSLSDVIEDDFDETKLSPSSLEKYKFLKQLRAQIFSDIYNQYNKE